jgi:hypothetical protein
MSMELLAGQIASATSPVNLLCMGVALFVQPSD